MTTESSLWVLEYRTRKRRNGKWSEWSSMEPIFRPVTANRVPPPIQMFDKYEQRAVEYVRKEPQP